MARLSLCVRRIPVDNDVLTTPSFWKAAALRALRSFAQGVLTLAGTGATGLFSIAWYEVLITAAGYAVASVLTSIVVGMPEAPPENLPPVETGPVT
jgi:hypothetical protein